MEATTEVLASHASLDVQLNHACPIVGRYIKLYYYSVIGFLKSLSRNDDNIR